MDRGQDPAWIWTRHWQRDQHEDCLWSALSLAGVWREYLSGFESGARLLDLATGSGEAAELAAVTARKSGRTFEVHAVDAAILPKTLVDRMRKGGVRLMDKIDITALPFEDGSYDGVFSQFGIEYGARPAAFHEAARVLRPNGRGMFVMHHKESVITRTCAMRLARHRDIIGPTQCFAAARQVFISYLLGGSRASVLQAETKFRNEVAVLRRRLGEPPSDPNLVASVRFLTEIAIAPGRYDPADALRRLQFVHDDLLSWRSRQEAQQQAALDSAELDSIGQWFAQAGLEVERPDVLRDGNGETAAWALRVRRPHAA